jgi:RIO-like serine/threonine protein kinase
MKIIKEHPCSKVWEDQGSIYKWQPKFLTENEIWCLEKMLPTGFVPKAERVELEIIRMEIIKDETPTDAHLLMQRTKGALVALERCGIRHGDLTRPNVLIKDNSPVLIDFSESRLATDPRPDKRPEGDRYWLARTIQEIFNGRS